MVAKNSTHTHTSQRHLDRQEFELMYEKMCFLFAQTHAYAHSLSLLYTSHSAIQMFYVFNFSCRITLLYSGELWITFIFQLQLLLQNNNQTFWNILVTTLPCKRQHNINTLQNSLSTVTYGDRMLLLCAVLYGAVLWLLTFYLFKNRLFIIIDFYVCTPNLFTAKLCNFRTCKFCISVYR